MHLDAIPERVLQYAVHRVLSDGRRRWCTTNGEYIQVLSPGVLNVHEGPDMHNMALLCQGAVSIADGEFHVRSADWFHHRHSNDARYDNVSLHIVLDNDKPVDSLRWTLVVPVADVLRRIRATPHPIIPACDHVDELQRAACSRLMRMIEHARRLVARLGVHEALRALSDEWFDRLATHRHHPVSLEMARSIRTSVAGSALGLLADRINFHSAQDLIEAVRRAELQRIANEGRAMRRELLMNVIFPVYCATASNTQLLVLFQWYWSVTSIHHYASLRRRFPGYDQTYMWQQQGMLEYVRLYSPVLPTKHRMP